MTDNHSPKGGESTRIHLLRDQVARRIAAGEVIERPYSVVRELIDNAVDSSADTIRLDIDNGGIGAIRCADNGIGMGLEDLKLCCLPHATSKINEVEDLSSLSTMGFRGEALASLAACSRLEILSRPKKASAAARLKIVGGKIVSLEEDRGGAGTMVSVEDLFYSLPARKKFLKSPGSEGTLCKNAFLEKALPFPQIGFRFFKDGKMRIVLPPGNLKDRVVHAYPKTLGENLIHLWEGRKENMGYALVASGSSLYRKDRRYVHIYVNRRRVGEYALIQAVEYGFREILPGGCFPYAFVFLTVPPETVDFNIHPAKKDVRFRDLPGIHKFLVEAIREHLGDLTGRRIAIPEKLDDLRASTVRQELLPSLSEKTSSNYGYPGGGGQTSWSAETRPSNIVGKGGARDETAKPVEFGRWQRELSPLPQPTEKIEISPPPHRTAETEEFKYLGQVMNLFLLVEEGESLFLIDQHAAHERILFDEAERLWGHTQELLVPLVFDLELSEERVFKSQLEGYGKLGFAFTDEGRGRWQLLSIPSCCEGMEDEILSFITDSRGDERELKKKIHAAIACKKAIKDGAYLDNLTARELVRKTFALEVPRCPHGRPLWFALTREELCRLVGREV